jgi:hypothetical protein
LPIVASKEDWKYPHTEIVKELYEELKGNALCWEGKQYFPM